MLYGRTSWRGFNRAVAGQLSQIDLVEIEEARLRVFLPQNEKPRDNSGLEGHKVCDVSPFPRYDSQLMKGGNQDLEPYPYCSH